MERTPESRCVMKTAASTFSPEEMSIKYVCGVDIGSQSCAGCILRSDKSVVAKAIRFANAREGWQVWEEYPLRPADERHDRETSVNLIRSLAHCELPRVRDATIALFILHPELAPAVLEVLQSSEPQVREQVAVLTLATLYLQRLWSVRLTLALGYAPAFPEEPFAFLWEQHHLPPPACGDGEWGLVALQEAEQQRSGMPLTFRGDWQNQVDHLLLQEEARRTGCFFASSAKNKRWIPPNGMCPPQGDDSFKNG